MEENSMRKTAGSSASSNDGKRWPPLSRDDLARQRDCGNGGRERPVRNINQVLMVCEEQDLRSSGEFAKNPETRRSAVVIEIDEKIVGDKGQRRGVIEIIFNGGHP